MGRCFSSALSLDASVARGNQCLIIWPCTKLVSNPFPTLFHCCIAPKSLGLLYVAVEPRRFCSNDRSRLMFYLIPQSKGEQKHHTSTCHGLLGYLTQSQHLSVCFPLQRLQVQREQHVKPKISFSFYLMMDTIIYGCIVSSYHY